VTGETRDGIPAGGGRGAGIVRHSIDGALDGADTVLVVVNLEPELAPALPGLAGLVAETGSPLSHLAILAREMHVPTVVAVPDARHRFPCGTRVVVDGTTGEISKLSAEVTP
jgi:pyruvate,water dikinase